ncbi:MAG: hypothetical protein FWC61_02470 [Proteobacteria bacterium]|nr:hypothetical protein [Pseudomonadota bacterium]
MAHAMKIPRSLSRFYPVLNLPYFSRGRKTDVSKNPAPVSAPEEQLSEKDKLWISFLDSEYLNIIPDPNPMDTYTFKVNNINGYRFTIQKLKDESFGMSYLRGLDYPEPMTGISQKTLGKIFARAKKLNDGEVTRSLAKQEENEKKLYAVLQTVRFPVPEK